MNRRSSLSHTFNVLRRLAEGRTVGLDDQTFTAQEVADLLAVFRSVSPPAAYQRLLSKLAQAEQSQGEVSQTIIKQIDLAGGA